jgi:hypothetical protein
MGIERRLQGVEPVNVSDEVFKPFAGKDVLDAHRQNGDTMTYGPFDLPANLRRLIGVGREDEHHDPALLNGIDDGLAPFHAGEHVSGSNPATDSLRLQHGADRIGGDLVFRGVADKDVVRHRSIPLNSAGEQLAIL